MKRLFGQYNIFFPSGFNDGACLYANSVNSCLTPGSEDRFKEAVYFASQMEAGYHNPQKFRYSLGAFLSAYGSISEIMRKELESNHRWNDWKHHLARIPTSITTNEYGPALKHARNTNIHQKSVFSGSYCQIGLYRGRRHKLSISRDIDWDIPSTEILERLWTSDFGKTMLDEEHSAFGEQYGVKRVYHVAKISQHLPANEKDLDLLVVIHRALLRTYDLLGLTHTMDGGKVVLPDGVEFLSPLLFSQVNLLLESDIRPELLKEWGWPDYGTELEPIPNF